MTRSEKLEASPAEVEAWLRGRDRYAGLQVSGFTPLRGGFWSAAWSYRAGDEEFVLRLGRSGEGFRIDEAAMRFRSAKLPVPEIVERGRAFGGSFAISRRHHGRFIEDAAADEAPAIGRAMAGLLAALRAVPSRPGEGVEWYASGGEPITWRAWLLRSLADDPASTVSGWRRKLATNPRMDALFRGCASRIDALLPACPERRDLVHGDLLHQNVLVAHDDPSRVTAVFSWKCSARGDFLYDVAWCTLWSPWHPAIAAADLWRQTLAAPDLDERDLADARLRHHCYELQIAASHLGWYAWTNDDAEQVRLAATAEQILERGPLPG